MDAPRTALVADAHMLTAEAVADVLAARRGFTVAGVVRTRAEVSAHLVAGHVDLLLTDVRLADDTEARLLTEISTRSPRTRVLVVTSDTDDWSIARAVEGCCHGYVLKDQRIDELLAAIDAVMRGETVFAAAVMSKVIRRLRPPSPSTDALTHRELDVLRCLADGHTTGQIAAELYVSRNTVKNHIGSVIRKLGAHSRLEAVSMALRDGVIRVR